MGVNQPELSIAFFVEECLPVFLNAFARGSIRCEMSPLQNAGDQWRETERRRPTLSTEFNEPTPQQSLRTVPRSLAAQDAA